MSSCHWTENSIILPSQPVASLLAAPRPILPPLCTSIKKGFAAVDHNLTTSLGELVRRNSTPIVCTAILRKNITLKVQRFDPTVANAGTIVGTMPSYLHSFRQYLANVGQARSSCFRNQSNFKIPFAVSKLGWCSCYQPDKNSLSGV